jgi:oligopeptidase B
MQKPPQPPKTLKKPVNTPYHGDSRVDEYAWLRNQDNPRVLSHIKAENDYADAVMKPTTRLQKELYTEIRARMKENDMSVPVKEGPYEYYSRTRKGKQYAIHCRKRITGGKEQVVLDENKLAAGEKYFSLGLFETSPDHRLLAYAVNTTGDEKYTLRIKDLRTGKLLAEKIDSIADFEWAENGEHFFYTVEEHPHPPRKIFLHRLGEDTKEDVMVYEEKDPQWYVGLDKSRSRKYIFFIAANFDSTEVRVMPAHHPFSPVYLMAPVAA